MASAFYSVQTPLSNAIGPVSDNYAPIPNLDPLVINNSYLQFGGTAALSLFLGYAWSKDIISFSLYVNIVETTTSQEVTEVYFGGTNGLSTTISLSAVYNIPPQTQPKFVAQWKVLGSPGVTIQAPTTLSFSALVFETPG